jgi:exodeoxyribonuclease VII small subunit
VWDFPEWDLRIGRRLVEMGGTEKSGVSLEEAFQELDRIIQKMQDREVSLEDSFLLYEQGIQMLKLCNQKIDAVEKKMLLLNAQGELGPFGEAV